MFSFIVINYNTAELTSACLESIFKYSANSSWEIILVDNNSNEADLNILKNRYGGRIKIITNQKNIGFARANNQGAKLAQGEYLFFLNSDTVFNQDILSSLRAGFDSDKEIGIIAPRLILKTGAEQEYSYGLKKGTNKLAWVSGAALVIRQEVFAKLGGWEERFFMYFEDVDLCRRALARGYKIERLLSIEITHLVGGSPISWCRRKSFYYRSKILFILKHYFKLI